MTDRVLRDLKASYKRNDILLPDIERHVLKSMAQRPKTRRSDVMHPSEMAKSLWCARHDYYRITKAPVDHKEPNPSFRMENVFDEGHRIHRKYQRWLREMGRLYGIWECRECKSTFWDISPPFCQQCHSPHLKYREVPLDDPSILIAGHADGIVAMPGPLEEAWGEYILLEVKSIGISTLRFENLKLYDRYLEEQLTPDELWFFINRPFSSHIRQGMLYGYMARRLYPHLDISKIVFIYEWKPTQAVKEFVVEYNEASITKVLDQALEVPPAVEHRIPPDRPAWAEAIDGKGCKSCDYRNTCWGVLRTSSTSTPNVRVRRVSAAQRQRVLRPSS